MKTDLLMRSLMFVPSHNEKLLRKAAMSDADVLLLDLEDSCQPSTNKILARELVLRFIDEGIFTLIEKRDSSYLEYDRTYRIDMLREVVVVDTLGFVPVKDSLFNGVDSYKFFANVPVEGVDAKFEIKSDIIEKNGYRVPVFEVKIAKDVILHDQDKDLLKQENETVSVDGVNGSAIVLGSLSEIKTNGNWPTIFDAVQ